MILLRKIPWRKLGHAGIGVILIYGMFVMGCGNQITLAMKGHKKLNTCGGEEAYSVVVRIYQLKNDANFKLPTIESFWKNDEEAIGEELVGQKQEVMLHPGESKEIKIKKEKEAKFIGAAADFCKPDEDGWRQIYSLDKGGKNLWVVVGDDRLVIEKR